ncbi:MAG: YfhO family protein, partial [Chloroflexota bacterium]
MLAKVLSRNIITEIAIAGGLITLATIGFFWQILLTNNAWMPAGGGDLAPFLYPNYYFAAETLREGILPLWNPHLYSGTPFAADIQTGLFYPINLIVFLLVPTLTFEWLQYLAVFHFWLAGVTMYACLRLINRQNPVKPIAAFTGAIAFEFSDLFVVHFGNLNMIAVAAWLPLVFLLFHHSLSPGGSINNNQTSNSKSGGQPRYGLAAASGAVLAIATLAGHIQITLFILLTLGLYTLWHLRFTIYDLRFVVKSRWRTIVSSFQPLFALAIAFGVMIGLSALLLLPAYEMSQYTPRAELPYEEAAAYSLHPVQMVGLLVPNYFGRDPALHWGPWDRVETGYIGVMTLLLALIGAVLSPRKIKFFFIGLGLIALLLAMGGYSIIHGWLYAIAPGFNQLRAPARFILLLDFSLAILAAFGLNQLLQPLTSEAKATFHGLLKPLTWGFGGLLIVALPLSYYALLVTQDRNPAIFNRATGAATGVTLFALFMGSALVVLHLYRSNWLREVQAGIIITALILLDLFTLGANVDVGHNNPAATFEHPAALDFLKTDPSLFRTEVTTDIWHLWQPNTGLLHGLDDAWGLYNPLSLADTTLYWSSAPPRSNGRYNFLGIKYIVASKAGAPADGNIVPVFDGDPTINIYLNQDAFARAIFVGQTINVSDHDAAWEAIHTPDFDPARAVVLEGGQTVNTQPVSTLALLQYDLHTIIVSVETDQPGYLVIPDSYYPGWQATVDGQPERIERANYAFRAIYVPAGQHTVQLVFDPMIWKIGLGITGLLDRIVAIDPTNSGTVIDTIAADIE